MIAIIIQARMGSTRLPGKVLKEIMGKPMLWHVITRAKTCKTADKVIVATTRNPADKPIVKLSEQLGAGYYAGSETDVLDRYYRAAVKYKVEVIVRITADCPLLDPRVVDTVVRRYQSSDYDYVSNTLKRSYPDGLDVEVFSFAALNRAWREAELLSEREHVTPYLWKNPDKFRLANVKRTNNLSALRFTVDEESDLEFVKQVYEHLYEEQGFFSTNDVLRLLNTNPGLQRINQGIAMNEGYALSVARDSEKKKLRKTL
jgi:spore coat polysaccharide biosynthesis protein SpsF